MKKNNINNNNEIKPIKVTVHIPENVSPDVRQRKINRLYDLLNPPEDETNEDNAGSNNTKKFSETYCIFKPIMLYC